MISDCLIPETRGKMILASCELDKEVTRSLDSGLVGLYMRKVFLVEPFTKNVPGAAVSPQLASFLRCQNIIKCRK